jgi:hypothetical protein
VLELNRSIKIIRQFGGNGKKLKDSKTIEMDLKGLKMEGV